MVLPGVHVAVTLCGFVLQVLDGVRGACTLFDHIRAPGVRRVEVMYWRSFDQWDTVPHSTLCHACPNAGALG